MAYTITTDPDLPAIVCTLGADFNLKADMENVFQELHRLLDQAGQPVYYVNDITDAKFSFSDIVLGMGMAASAGGVLRHQNLYEMIVISASDVVKLGVKALGQAQYGGLNARIANNLDEATSFIKAEVSKAK